MSPKKDSTDFKHKRLCDLLNENQFRTLRKVSKDYDMPIEWVFSMIFNLGRKRWEG